MIRYLIKKWIPDYADTKNPIVRKRYGVLGGVLGIICNGFLFLLKLLVGTAIGSIAVISDAFNNLSDMASSLVSAFGAAWGGKNADSGHPYGHGRAEYISALVVSMLILLFGIELFQNSVMKIFQQETVELSLIAGVLLGVSVLVKIWMWSYHRYLGKTINSAMLLASAKDCRNDAIATSVILLAATASPVIPLPLDGILGVVVSCLILMSGVGVAKEVIDKLMGEKPSEELRQSIEERVMSDSMILGMHDLMVHDYGPGRLIASVHAEVPKNLSLTDVHDVIDRVEKQILKDLNVNIVIHMDPR